MKIQIYGILLKNHQIRADLPPKGVPKVSTPLPYEEPPLPHVCAWGLVKAKGWGPKQGPCP